MVGAWRKGLLSNMVSLGSRLIRGVDVFLIDIKYVFSIHVMIM